MYNWICKSAQAWGEHPKGHQGGMGSKCSCGCMLLTQEKSMSLAIWNPICLRSLHVVATVIVQPPLIHRCCHSTTIVVQTNNRLTRWCTYVHDWTIIWIMSGSRENGVSTSSLCQDIHGSATRHCLLAFQWLAAPHETVWWCHLQRTF